MPEITTGDGRLFVNKFKMKKDAEVVTVEYTRTTSTREDDYTLVCTGEDAQPALELVQAMDAIVDIVVELLKFQPEWRDGLRVSGVRFTENEKQGFGASITAIKTYMGMNGVLVLNVPHHCVGATGEEGPNKLSDAQAQALRRLQVAAERYLNGERAQQSLFDPKMAAAGDDTLEAGKAQGEAFGQILEFKRGKSVAEAAKDTSKKPGKGKVTRRKGVKGVDEDETND